MSLLFAMQLALCALGVGDLRFYPHAVQLRCAPIREARAALPTPAAAEPYQATSITIARDREVLR